MSLENTSTETTPETSVDTTTAETSTPSQVVDTQSVEPEWTPNYKYKAYGKENEVDEWARPLINKDNQDHMIKLYERAGGFDHLKSNFKELEQKHSTTEQTLNQFNQIRHTILSSIDKGDLDKAFQVIGLDENKIFNYVKQKLEYQQLPHDQRQIVDQYRATQEARQYAESLADQQRRFAEDIMMQKHELEMSMTFSNPKYSSTINEYNTKLGDENAFKSVIQQIGATEFYQTGRHMPVAEATEKAIRMLALNPAQAVEISQSQGNGMVAAPQVAQSQTPNPKPIMKIGKGGGSTPVAQRPRSIADLNKLYQQEYGA